MATGRHDDSAKLLPSQAKRTDVTNGTFKQALRQLRSSRGLKQHELGALVYITDRYISDLERGKRRPHDDLAKALDDALDAGGLLVTLAAQHPAEAVNGPWDAPAAHDVLTHVVESALVDRRGFLILSGSAATGLALAWTAARPGPMVVTANGWVTPDAVTHLQNRVEELWLLDDVMGGGGCLDAGVSDLRLVERLIRRGRYSREVGARLHSLAAALARFCGWAAFDAGREAAAQRFWHAGLRIAAAVGDVDQGVYILSNLALQAAYAGDGGGVVDMLDVARARVDPAARTVLAMLDCWAARGHALTGDKRMAAARLNRADDLWDRRRPGDDPEWVYWMPQPSLTAEAGTALLDAGDLGAAEHSLTVGMEGLDDNSARERNLYLVRMSEVRLRDGRLDEATTTAREALDSAVGVDSARVRQRMDHLMDAMPADEPLVTELLDYRRHLESAA
jgi:transcriptional regulator with XRE-family HTH domain